jgi:predicted metal-dependent enzyme (double-stranded beta helix superfamily)
MPDPLSRAELRELVTRLSKSPETWADHVRHVPDQRTYETIVYDGRVGVWLICWMDDHDTGFHDHDVSSGAVSVVAGRLREERLALGTPVSRVYGPGDVFEFGASDIHRMSHAGGGPAVSIHAYSPPLARMGAYSIDGETSLLRRVSISYEEELRPTSAVA